MILGAEFTSQYGRMRYSVNRGSGADEIEVRIVVRDFNRTGLGYYETPWAGVMVPVK
jgi:hypothetical protein